MTSLQWSAPALADLRAIDAWLQHETSADVAIRTLTEIRWRTDFLSAFPHGGRPALLHSFRLLRVIGTPSLILYRLTDAGPEILRLRHQREDRRVMP